MTPGAGLWVMTTPVPPGRSVNDAASPYSAALASAAPRVRPMKLGARKRSGPSEIVSVTVDA